MLYKVFDFADKEVSDVMVPRPEVVALSVDLPPEEALAAVLDSPYTRYPVYRESLDDIVGILHVRDLFSALHDRGIANVDVEELVRPAYIVPETKDLAALLTEFRRTNQHMAIVVDEYGAMEGIVTLEDLLEEIVGEIEDEFDLPDETIERDRRRHDPDRRHVPDRRLQRAVRDATCRSRTTTRSPASSSACSGARAEPGDEVDYDGLRFDVLEVEGQRIDRLAVTFVERTRRAEGSRGRGLARAGPILGRIAPTAFSETSEPQAWPRPRGFPRPDRLVAQRRRASRASGRPSTKRLGKLGLRTIADLLEHRPHRLRSRGRGGADRRPARPTSRRSRSRARSSGTTVRRPRRRARDRPGAHRRRQRADHGRLVQPAVARREAHAGHARPPARACSRRNEFNVRSYDLDGASATADFAPVYPASEDLTVKKLRELSGSRSPARRATCPIPLPAGASTLPLRARRPRRAPLPARLRRRRRLGRRRLAFDELLVAPGRARSRRRRARARRGARARRAGRADRALPRACCRSR